MRDLSEKVQAAVDVFPQIRAMVAKVRFRPTPSELDAKVEELARQAGYKSFADMHREYWGQHDRLNQYPANERK